MKCPECGGRGHNSRHLGAFSAEEFDEAFGTDEEKEAYIRGDYDQVCPACKGKGEITHDRMTAYLEEVADQRLADQENGYYR